MDLSSNRFFEGFSPAGRAAVVASQITEQYQDGEFIFHQDDSADGVCLILDGEVEIFRQAGQGRQILGTFKAGDYMGEVAVLDGFGRSTDARAKGQVMIAKIPREAVLKVLEAEPLSLTLRIFQQVMRHLRRSNDLVVHEVVHKQKLSLVGEMASSLMHDLRNPIAGIGLAADLITMNHSDEETVRCCDGIRLQCERLVTMAAELLEFSRGESKLQISHTTAIDFLEQFNTLNGDYFQTTGVDFTLEAKPDEIDIDKMRLFRVLQNLVSNAVEALADRPDGKIVIRAWVEDGLFNLTVSDNGSGIPETVRERIFEPFVTHGKRNGTGLGMAIVRNVATAHGGTVTFETELGVGTTFILQMPATRKQTQALPMVAAGR